MAESVCPANIVQFTAAQTATIAAAEDAFGLLDPAGKQICVRRRENESQQARQLVRFTPEQWATAVQAQGSVEVRGSGGETLGYLVLDPAINLFYTVAEVELLLQRAREPGVGRTLGEILSEALTRAGA
jgi:hypothetical protein